GHIFDIIGASYDHSSSGMFLWGRISQNNLFLDGSDPRKCLGERVSDNILYNAGVFITPGFIFGKNGENYVRVSLCAKTEVLADAASKILKITQK
ncbi:MAG: hypothetical protein WCS67_08670, partial [Bacteroidales bacterium]